MKQYVVLLMMHVLRSCCVIGLFVVFHAHAMEMIKQNPSIPCNDICYLNQMPRDILDYIASFLMETEEEFVARTQIKKDIKKEIMEFFCKSFVKDSFFSILSASCPDEKKALFLVKNRELLCNGHKINVASMIIIDGQKNNDNDKIMYQRKLDDRNQYRNIALSCACSMIAGLYGIDEGEVRDYCNYGIRVEKVITQKKWNMALNSRMVPERIFFNKQGTDLIVHGKNVIGEDIHKIFSLKTVDQNKSQAIPKITNKLQVYLQDKCVCNKYIEGKK